MGRGRARRRLVGAAQARPGVGEDGHQEPAQLSGGPGRSRMASRRPWRWCPWSMNSRRLKMTNLPTQMTPHAARAEALTITAVPRWEEVMRCALLSAMSKARIGRADPEKAS